MDSRLLDAFSATPCHAPARVALLPFRVFYFLSFGALGALFPYLPLLLSTRGLDAREISWVMVCIPVGNLVVPPLWGVVADKLGARLALLRMASMGCAVGALLLLPNWPPDLVFWGNLGAVAVFAFFRAPLTSLADASVSSALGGERAAFGSVRVWGSVGFLLFVSLVGLYEPSHNTLLLLGVTCTAYVAAGLTVWGMYNPPYAQVQSVLRQTLKVSKRPQVLLFLGGSIFYCMGHSAYDAFFGLRMRALGYSDGFVGTAWAVGVAVEVVVMFLTPRYIANWRSGGVLAFCGIIAALRWLLLASLTDGSVLMGLQALHAVTFGLWYLALFRFVQNRAPDTLRTSLQSVTLSSVGLGMVVGYLGGGVLMKQYGGGGVFLAAALCAGCAVPMYLAAVAQDRLRQPTVAVDPQ